MIEGKIGHNYDGQMARGGGVLEGMCSQVETSDGHQRSGLM